MSSSGSISIDEARFFRPPCDRLPSVGHHRDVRAPSILIATAVLASTAFGAGCGAPAASPASARRTATADTMAISRTANALPAGFERSLSDAWACGDLLLHVANPERSIMLTLYWPQLLDQATPDQATGGWAADVGGDDGPRVAIVVHTGRQLDAGTCARQGDQPAVIAQTWTAVAEDGHLELAATEPSAPRLSTWLRDVELRREGDGATVVMKTLEQVGVELAG